MITETSPLERAKERLRIPELWQRLGLQGEAAKSCRSPFREDRTASFSVNEAGTLWNDFAEKAGGDAVAFLARAAGIDMKDAAKRFISMAGTASGPKPETTTTNKKRSLQKIKPWTMADSMNLANLRHWPLWAGLEIAARRDLLGIINAGDGRGPKIRCWAITDTAHTVMQYRRLDGKPFAHRWDDKHKTWKPCEPFKSKTLCGEGAGASWPVGTAALTDGRDVLFCEGGPDFLAAFGIAFLAEKAQSLDVVAMLGASNSIAADALPKFAGKRIRIFRHADAAGKAAALSWAAQLEQAGAKVDICKVTGKGVTDLADAYSQIDEGDEAERLLAGLGKAGE